MTGSKTAVVLFNLGGPDSPEAIRPFLRNLFSDKRIITAPTPFRQCIAWVISTTRAPKVKPLYAHMGGASPILPNTQAQAQALEILLNSPAHTSPNTYKCFIAMRYWHPFTEETAKAVQAYQPDKIVLLPLYPQFSTTTTESSFVEWERVIKKINLTTPTNRINSYPAQPGFIAAEEALLKPVLEQALAEHPQSVPRLLFSAHGLPKKIITQKGDPYALQVEQTVKAIVASLDKPDLDWRVTYQSRVGPVEWLQPYTDEEIRRAGAEGKPVILVPIAFVSEHIETLVELDIENRHLAEASGCPGYYRVPTVSTHPLFIEGLAQEIRSASSDVPSSLPTRLPRA